jgi:acetyl esterase
MNTTQMHTDTHKILLSWSSGKDSAWALHLLRQRGDIEVVGLVTTFNESAGRVAMHAVRRELAEEAGVRVLAVDYRLGPEDPFPAAYDDAVAAHRWLVEHAADVGADPARIAVGGDSAGGNLAAGVAIEAARAGLPLAFQLLVYPVTDATSRADADPDAGFTREDMDWFWGHYAPDAEQRAHPDASPLRAESLAGLPPAYVVVAEYDPLKEDGLRYAARLEEAGVPVTVTTYDDQMHAFFSMPNFIDVGNKAIAAAGAAIKAAV